MDGISNNRDFWSLMWSYCCILLIMLNSRVLNCYIFTKIRFRTSTRGSSSSFSASSTSSGLDDNSLTPVFPSSVEYPNFSFDVIHEKAPGRERLGILKCPSGTVETPSFVFCATKAAMKAMTPAMLREANTQFILSNTYHLMLTPGSEIIQNMGGLQKFTGWKGPMLTDSGGYQIFSMGYGSVAQEIKGNRNTESLGWDRTLIKIDEEGATFRSYVDGSIHHLTPERSIDIQKELGADFIVVLDECTPYNVDKEYTADSMRRSHRWALRSLEQFTKVCNDGKQAIYGIIQGGVYNDLRDESIDFVNKNPFFGVAIGGSLGANKKTMHDIVGYTRSKIDANNRPVHLLGIGNVL
jgi:queuine tRNA-ribosyltransferase